MQNPEVLDAIEDQKRALAAVSRASVALVVRELLSLATADEPTCCRYCHGENHGYQWTCREFERALDAALSGAEPPPDPAGGFGWIKTRRPFSECPVCNGDGISAKKELQPKDKLKALELLGRYLGMLVDRKEVSGPGGGPVQLQAVRPEELSDDQLAALVASAPQLALSGGSNGGIPQISGDNPITINAVRVPE